MMDILVFVLSLFDIAAATMLIFHIKFLAWLVGLVVFLKGLSGYTSAISSGFFFDIFSLMDIISGFSLLTAFSMPLPYTAIGFMHLVKGIIMVLLSIPYSRF